MIVDTSAICAVLFDEDEGDAFLRMLVRAERVQLSAGNWIELAPVLSHRRTGELEARLDWLIKQCGITISAVSVAQADLARDAYRRFGRGTGHPAKLNFGDCFAYALAKETGEPLLFKGDDFRHTDIRAAL
ncbi:MAG: type II toxin-antitoxin system VapC family toxin [Pseudomonadota bacterium]